MASTVAPRLWRGTARGDGAADAAGPRLGAISVADLSGMVNAVEARYTGAVSGMSLTSANIANAMGVAVGSVLFLHWLNCYGMYADAVPAYMEWGREKGLE